MSCIVIVQQNGKGVCSAHSQSQHCTNQLNAVKYKYDGFISNGVNKVIPFAVITDLRTKPTKFHAAVKITFFSLPYSTRGREVMVQFDEFVPLAKRMILTVYKARDPSMVG